MGHFDYDGIVTQIMFLKHPIRSTAHNNLWLQDIQLALQNFSRYASLRNLIELFFRLNAATNLIHIRICDSSYRFNRILFS